MRNLILVLGAIILAGCARELTTRPATLEPGGVDNTVVDNPGATESFPSSPVQFVGGWSSPGRRVGGITFRIVDAYTDPVNGLTLSPGDLYEVEVHYGMLDSTLLVTKRMSNNGQREVWAHADKVEQGTRFVTSSFGPWDQDTQSWLGAPSRMRGDVVSEVASLTTRGGSVYTSFPFSDPPVVAREEIGVNTSTLAFLMLSGEKDGYPTIELAAREAGVELPTTQYINLKNVLCGAAAVAGGLAIASGSPHVGAGAAGLGIICGGMMLLEELVGHGDDDFWETDPDPDPLPPPPDSSDPSGRMGGGSDR